MINLTVEFFNLPYFIFIAIALGLIFGLYYLLRNKSMTTKKTVVLGLLLFNLAFHFIKLTFPPYSTDPEKAMRDVWFINVCAVSILTFPFYFIINNKTLKDFMFYLGVISGTLAMLIPTVALGEQVISWDTMRFYVAHMIILIAPLLMVLLKIHKLDYKRIWKMPIMMFIVLLFIMIQQIMQSEIGIIALRNSDFFNPNYTNPSLIWGPGDDSLAKLFTIFTPDVLKIVPYGEHAGSIKYWPAVWFAPSITVYFIVLPLLICLPWELKHIKSDIKYLATKTKNLFIRKKAK